MPVFRARRRKGVEREWKQEERPPPASIDGGLRRCCGRGAKEGAKEGAKGGAKGAKRGTLTHLVGVYSMIQRPGSLEVVAHPLLETVCQCLRSLFWARIILGAARVWDYDKFETHVNERQSWTERRACRITEHSSDTPRPPAVKATRDNAWRFMGSPLEPYFALGPASLRKLTLLAVGGDERNPSGLSGEFGSSSVWRT